MANYGLKTSLADKDVLTAPVEDLSFSSEMQHLKVGFRGEILVQTSGEDGSEDGVIPHDLGYVPTAYCFGQSKKHLIDGTKWWEPDTTRVIQGGEVGSIYLTSWLTTSNLIVNLRHSEASQGMYNNMSTVDKAMISYPVPDQHWLNGYYPVKYFIMLNPADEATSSTPDDPGYGIKASLPFNDVETCDIEQLAMDSDAEMLKIYRAGSGTELMGAGGTTTKTVSIAFDSLGYIPLFMAYVKFPPEGSFYRANFERSMADYGCNVRIKDGQFDLVFWNYKQPQYIKYQYYIFYNKLAES